MAVLYQHGQVDQHSSSFQMLSHWFIICWICCFTPSEVYS